MKTPIAHRGRSFVTFRPSPAARVRLFCFPHAGGRPAAFRPWLEHVPDDVELCAVALPGRDGPSGERPVTQLSELVPRLARDIRAHLGTAFAFFGHSLGALVAFEVARELRRCHGIEPVHLFVAGRSAPHRRRAEPPVHQLPDPGFIDAVQRRWGAIPRAVLRERELLALVLPALRADVALVETYVYRPDAPLGCAISCFGGVDDTTVTRDELNAWREQTRAAFILRMVPGGHFFPGSAPRRLVAAVHDDLVSALEGRRPEHPR
jgi:medium-chain acyl-[acyl-carrier-protein] hydrolase